MSVVVWLKNPYTTAFKHSCCRSNVTTSVNRLSDVQSSNIPETSEKIFDLIVTKWITICGFSFADSIMEMYKITNKQGHKIKEVEAQYFTEVDII